MTIELQDICKEFGTHVALDKVSFTIQEGLLTSLLGPSGCGKTSLLRIISGLEAPSSGKMLINDIDCTYDSIQQRNMGFVFQHYSLFKHMSAFENVAFGLRVRQRKEEISNQEIKDRVHESLSLVQLDNQSHKYPHQLSGGQQQRVALARVLVIKPRILLLDEPFGALDATVRRDLRRWLRRLHDEIHITTVLVTHDQEEALEISDTVVLLNHGKLEQVGTPREIYKNPGNPFVYEFLGAVNVFSGRLKDSSLVHFSADPQHKEELIRSDNLVYVRPHELAVLKENDKQKGDLSGTIIRISFVATTVLMEIRVESGKDVVVVEASIDEKDWERHKFRPGDTVFVRPEHFTRFPTKPNTKK